MPSLLGEINIHRYAVIGLGRFGTSVVRTLTGMGHRVIAVDRDERRVEQMAGITPAVQADATDADALAAAHLDHCDTVVVAIGEDMQASILATLNLKQMGVPQVVAKAVTEAHGQVLARVGADRVIFPERDMGRRVAHKLVATRVRDHVQVSEDYSMAEIEAGDMLVGKSLAEADLAGVFGVNVIALRRGAELMVPPSADTVFATGDVIVVLGPSRGVQRLEESHVLA